MYQSKPQKIISYDNIKKIFLELILPQQFLFRQDGFRVFIPDFLTTMTLTYYGRNHYVFGKVQNQN